MRLAAFALLAALAAAPAAMHAQAPVPERYGLTAPRVVPAHLDRAGLASRRIESRTHWMEGGIIGGVVTVTIGFLFLIDKDSEGKRAAPLYAVPPLTVLSGLVGFAPGALLGSLIPKR
jgi:hypothetical protein